MRAIKLPNGNLLIPAAATTGEVRGDGMYEASKDSEEYKQWLPYAVDDPDTVKQYMRLNREPVLSR